MTENQIRVVRGYFSTADPGYCVASPSPDGGLTKEIKTDKQEAAFTARERAAKEAQLFYFDGKFLWQLVAGK